MKPSPSFALPSGTIIHGKEYDYIIRHYIANGTFGITYLAEVAVRKSSQLPFLVAIKEFFMHETNGRYGTSVTTANENGEFAAYRRKFIREAKNLKRMNHPNIIKVIECFDANNTTYYSMEYLEGGDLDHYIRQHGPLSELTAFRFAKQISIALQYMHSKHMLHFDLKPKNVMLRDDESAVLIDFGLSKELDSTGAPESSTNIGKGTPGYAPIEQADYKPGNGFPATIDIYALGATMYKMLTKQTPPTASDALNNGLSLNLLRGRVDADTIDFIAKAMAPKKDERFQSVGEVLDIVEHKLEVLDDTAGENSILDDSWFEYREPPTMYGAPSPIRRNIIKELIGANKKKLLAFFIVVVAIGAIVKMYPWMSSLFNYERKAWRTARQEDSYESYMTFIESNSQSKYVNDALLRMLRTKCTDENRSLGALRYIWDADTLTGRENTIEITDTIKALTSRWVSFARSLDTDLQNYSFEEDYSNPRNLSYLEELTRHFLKVDHMEMEILMFFSAQGSYRGYLSTQDGRCIYPVEYNVLTVQENIAACRDSLEAVLRISDNVFCRGIDKLNEGKFYTTQDYKPYYDSAISIVNHYFQIRNKDYGFLYSFTESMEYFCIIPDNADGAPSKPKNRRVVVEEAVETIEETIE